MRRCTLLPLHQSFTPSRNGRRTASVPFHKYLFVSSLFGRALWSAACTRLSSRAPLTTEGRRRRASGGLVSDAALQPENGLAGHVATRRLRLAPAAAGRRRFAFTAQTGTRRHTRRYTQGSLWHVGRRRRLLLARKSEWLTGLRGGKGAEVSPPVTGPVIHSVTQSVERIHIIKNNNVRI